MLVKDVLQKTTQFFRDKGISTARLDTEILLAKALNWERMKLYLNYEYPLNEAELTACRDLVRRRATGEPVAYITGQREFYNHSFAVYPGILIPRPETETIVETVIKWASGQGIKIVDLGSGSGCIGLSILAEISTAQLFAVDVSATAVKATKLNAETLDVVDRVIIAHKSAEAVTSADVVAAFGSLADAVLANPPYIAEDDSDVEPNVKKFEPFEALFSPDGGLSHIESWSLTASQCVRPGGLVMFEIGHRQGPQVLRQFSSITDFENVQLVKDLAGTDRFVKCFRRANISSEVSHG